MSRIEFRAQLDSPRPRAALAMVAAANGTLAITGQLAPWIWPLQALVLGLTAWRHGRPFRWQRNAPFLNTGLALAVSSAVVPLFDGAPPTVTLAHFTVLASGLQLLDARPRASEFLLVALALFQVVVASSLTDSPFFPLLVVAFLLATVWTLVVHTLRVEAAEAGASHTLHEVITPSLARMTAVASAGSLLLALLLFLVLPRMHAGAGLGAGLQGPLAMSGFHDRVELGDLGRIRQDHSVVLRVETLEGVAPDPSRAYWRGLSFDHFDGRVWSVTPRRRLPVNGRFDLGVQLAAAPDGPDWVQRIIREPVVSGVLFSLGRAVHLSDGVGTLQHDGSGGIYAVGSQRDRLRYVVQSRALPGRPGADAGAGIDDARFQQLPPLGPEVAALARKVTAGSDSDARRAADLETFLRREGRYSDTPPVLDPDDPRTPVEAFLSGSLAGHCEFFASAFVVLARSLDLPARLVNGFAGGRTNRIGGFAEVSRADAHAWAEIHFRDVGWVRYDPTPPDLRSASPTPGLVRLRELLSALEHLWYQQVVEFDRSDQLRGLRAVWARWRRLRGEAPGPGVPGPRRDAAPSLPDLRIVLALGLAATLGLALWRRRSPGAAELPAAYARAIRLLARAGLERSPAETPRAFAVSAAGRLPEDAARAFSELTESYLGWRYGGRPAPAGDAALAILREGLRRDAC